MAAEMLAAMRTMSHMREATPGGWSPAHRPSTTGPRTTFSYCILLVWILAAVIRLLAVHLLVGHYLLVRLLLV
jgi:hypothetical protein